MTIYNEILRYWRSLGEWIPRRMTSFDKGCCFEAIEWIMRNRNKQNIWVPFVLDGSNGDIIWICLFIEGIEGIEDLVELSHTGLL